MARAKKGIEICQANKKKYAEEKVKEEKIATAATCLKKGMAVEDIAVLTGLKKNEINNINL